MTFFYEIMPTAIKVIKENVSADGVVTDRYFYLDRDEPFDSGHMKYGNDTDGLQAYLVECGFMLRSEMLCHMH